MWRIIDMSISCSHLKTSQHGERAFIAKDVKFSGKINDITGWRRWVETFNFLHFFFYYFHVFIEFNDAAFAFSIEFYSWIFSWNERAIAFEMKITCYEYIWECLYWKSDYFRISSKLLVGCFPIMKWKIPPLLCRDKCIETVAFADSMQALSKI